MADLPKFSGLKEFTSWGMVYTCPLQKYLKLLHEKRRLELFSKQHTAEYGTVLSGISNLEQHLKAK